MAKKIRITRKMLKEDEVRDYWLLSLDWLLRNRKPLLIGLAAAAVVFLLAITVQKRFINRDAAAGLLLSRALTQSEAALFSQDETERENLFQEAIESLRTLLDAHGRSKAAPKALYLLGNVAFFQNRYDEAERHFQDYINAVDRNTDKADGYIALGYTCENRFFWSPQQAEDRPLLDRAMQNYRQAEQLTSGTAQHYQALLCQARLYDLQLDQEDKARELYRRVAVGRKLPAPPAPPAKGRDAWQMVVQQLKLSRHMFTLAETARLRLEQLEAGQ